MRSIPLSLQEKINKVNQTLYENANPKMSAQVRRAKTSLTDTDLFYVETIREKPGLNGIALALYRPDPTKAPTFVYEIHNDNGMIKTTLRDLSDFREDRWKHQFDVGVGRVCSIEFNGIWMRDALQRYNLVTEEKPYLFWTDNADVLWTQKWDDLSSRIQLATNVIKIATLRGWKTVNHVLTDQGLICAYIKTDNKVYYRNYCEQADDSNLWEYEKEIIAFVPPVQNIGLFRTIDYRAGFVAECSGIIKWLLTARSWSGMATPAENLTLGLANYTIAVTKIIYTNMFHIENVSVALIEEIMLLFAGQTLPIVAVNIASTVHQLAEPLSSATNEYLTAWYPLVPNTAIVKEAGVLLVKGTDYTINEATGTITTSKTGSLTAEYDWTSYGHKIKLSMNYGLRNIIGNQAQMALADSASKPFSCTGLAYGDQNTPTGNFPKKEIILATTNFNESTGQISVNFGTSVTGIVGEADQVVANFGINFTPIGLIVPRISISAPTVGGIWNE